MTTMFFGAEKYAHGFLSIYDGSVPDHLNGLQSKIKDIHKAQFNHCYTQFSNISSVENVMSRH